MMYRLNVQVTAYGRQTVPDKAVVRSSINHNTGAAEP